MEESKKIEELQSRREFFKQAAKKALPIIGAIVLANVPLLSHAAEKDITGCEGCNSNCRSGCKTSCHMGCGNGCYVNCKAHTSSHGGSGCEYCSHLCNGCKGECNNTCSGSCVANNYTLF